MRVQSFSVVKWHINTPVLYMFSMILKDLQPAVRHVMSHELPNYSAFKECWF
jgi:hypothetical protein